MHAPWPDLRLSLSFRDVKELLAERGIVVAYESIRRWVLTFGPVIARGRRPSLSRVAAPYCRMDAQAREAADPR